MEFCNYDGEGKNEFYGVNDELFLKYCICDDVELQKSLPGGQKIQVLKQVKTRRTMNNQDKRAKYKCSKCKQSRHNARTCKRRVATDVVDFLNEELDERSDGSYFVGPISTDVYSES